jgi:hypothetical protein
VKNSDKLKVNAKKFRYVGESGLDDRKRVTLGKALVDKIDALATRKGGVRFKIYVNDYGEVLLSPQVSIPLRELWLHLNPEAAASVKRGLEQSAVGETVDLGSFAQFADDDID